MSNRNRNYLLAAFAAFTFQCWLLYGNAPQSLSWLKYPMTAIITFCLTVLL